MEDGGMGDEKIIAIPYGDPTYMGYTDIHELPKHIFEELKHFFTIYKHLEGKSTTVNEFGGPIAAVEVIEKCMENYKKKFVDQTEQRSPGIKRAVKNLKGRLEERPWRHLIFSLNATIPVFLLMVLGLALRKIGWIDEGFASKMNQFVFRVPLPVLLFQDLATVDFYEMWDWKICSFLFCCHISGDFPGRSSLLSSERPEHQGGVYPGFLPEQRCSPGDCFYPEYLWFCWDRPLDDHRQCSFV